MFQGKNIAITGAHGGIGRAFAEMFISNGANVAISDIKDPSKVAKDIGAKGFVCDVSNESSVQTFISAAENELGPLDMFIANAGIGFSDYPVGHAAGADNMAWQKSWDVNVMGAVYAARAVLPAWIERQSGNFIIVASAAGLLNQIGSASYSATKHAAVGFAEAIGIAHKDDGISVHCVCPQYVKTNMTKGMKFAERNPDELLEPADVAETLKSAIIDDRFMVLPHAVVGDYFKAKAMDYDRYISGMAKLKSKIHPSDVLINTK